MIALLGLIAALSPANAWAEGDGGHFTCSLCDRPPQDVAVLVAAAELRGRLRDYAAVRNWFAPPPGLPTFEIWIRSADELPAALLEMAAACRRVKHLGVFPLGNLGYLSFGDGRGLAAPDVEPLLGNVGCALAPGARVELGGYGFARGCRGQDLMMALAYHLLPEGGSIRANTHQGATLFYGAIQSRNIDLQTKTFHLGPGPSAPRWDARSPPSTAARCASRLETGFRYLDTIQERLKSCAIAREERFDLVRAAHLLKRAQSAYAPVLRDRAGVSSSHRRAWVRYYEAWDKYYAVRDGFLSRNPCGIFGKESERMLEPGGPALLPRSALSPAPAREAPPASPGSP